MNKKKRTLNNKRKATTKNFKRTQSIILLQKGGKGEGGDVPMGDWNQKQKRNSIKIAPQKSR